MRAYIKKRLAALTAVLALEGSAAIGNKVYDATRKYPAISDCQPNTLPHCFKGNSIVGSSTFERISERLHGTPISGHPLNAQGYLGPDFTNEPSKTTVTIVGASTNFPFCEEETQDELGTTLSTLLNEKYLHRQFVVRNASVVGRSPLETSRQVRYLAETFPSDIIYEAEPVNAISQGHDIVYSLENLQHTEPSPLQSITSHDPLLKGLLRLTRGYTSITSEEATPKFLPEFGEAYPSRFRGKVQFRTIEEAINDMHAASNEHNFQLVLGVLPMRPELDVNIIPAYFKGHEDETRRALYDLHQEVNATFKRKAHELGIPLVDNATPFEEPLMSKEDAQKNFCDYVHALPSIKRKQAENIANTIQQILPDTEKKN